MVFWGHQSAEEELRHFNLGPSGAMLGGGRSESSIIRRFRTSWHRSMHSWLKLKHAEAVESPKKLKDGKTHKLLVAELLAQFRTQTLHGALGCGSAPVGFLSKQDDLSRHFRLVWGTHGIPKSVATRSRSASSHCFSAQRLQLHRETVAAVTVFWRNRLGVRLGKPNELDGFLCQHTRLKHMFKRRYVAVSSLYGELTVWLQVLRAQRDAYCMGMFASKLSWYESACESEYHVRWHHWFEVEYSDLHKIEKHTPLNPSKPLNKKVFTHNRLS